MPATGRIGAPRQRRVFLYRCDLALTVHDLDVCVVAPQAGHEAGTPVEAASELVDPAARFVLRSKAAVEHGLGTVAHEPAAPVLLWHICEGEAVSAHLFSVIV